jgi:small subunit ribosomal protein S20
MPVTKTAKRALRSSSKKAQVNKKTFANLEVALRMALKTKTAEKIKKAISLADKAAKKHAIHKNKAARIKVRLTKLLPKTTKLKVSKK